MIYVAEIFLLLCNLAMAAYHAKLIKNGKPIKHGLWGGGYLAVAVAVSIWQQSWILFVCSLLIRKVFFDLALNFFRGLPLFYVSSSTTSILDKLHNKVFGKRSEIYMAIYFIAIIILNFI